MCSGPTFSQGQDSRIKSTTYLSAVCSFDQDSALVRRSDKTPAASVPAQVPDYGTGAPQEWHAYSPSKKAAHTRHRPSRCRLVGSTRKRPPHEVATGSRRRGKMQTYCRHQRQRATGSLAAG